MPRMASGYTGPRKDLTGSFEQYPMWAAEQGYVGLSLFPRLEVTQDSGRYGVIPLEQIKKGGINPDDLARSDTGDYASLDYKLQHITYQTKEYGLNVPTDDREAARFSTYVDAEMQATNLARLTLMDAMEKRIVDMATDSAVYTGASLTGAVTASWKSAPTTAVPLDDIINAMEKVLTNTGMKPNTICMGWRDLMYFKRCSTVLDSIKYNQRATPEDISNDDIANYLGFSKVLIAGAFRNTTTAIDAAPALSRFWPSGKIWIGITANDGDSHRAVSAGRTHHWAGDGSQIQGAVEQYYSHEKRGSRLRTRHEIAPQVIYTNAAYILTGAAA